MDQAVALDVLQTAFDAGESWESLIVDDEDNVCTDDGCVCVHSRPGFVSVRLLMQGHGSIWSKADDRLIDAVKLAFDAGQAQTRARLTTEPMQRAEHRDESKNRYSDALKKLGIAQDPESNERLTR